MDHDAIVDGVATRADLDSRDAAERAAIETLRTLGEHVSTGESDDLATKLPGELGKAVRAHGDAAPPSYDPDAFAARVAEREGGDVSDDDAMAHARAVLAAVAAQGAGQELRDAREQLPDEYDALFETAELPAE